MGSKENIKSKRIKIDLRACSFSILPEFSNSHLTGTSEQNGRLDDDEKRKSLIKNPEAKCGLKNCQKSSETLSQKLRHHKGIQANLHLIEESLI